MLILTRGSLRRFRPLAREFVVLKTTFSPSVSIQTTLVCGRPSSPTVATTAKFLPLSRSRCLSVSVAMTYLPFDGSRGIRWNAQGIVLHPGRRALRSRADGLDDLPCDQGSPGRCALR